MGVTYKLKDEVVQFIISQRQDNPLSSCRQLAESASQKFSLRLSKSSVHDVLKESGIITPRGRKPKAKFEIPQEKKQQIQTSLSQIRLLPDPVESKNNDPVSSVILSEGRIDRHSQLFAKGPDTEISPEYEGAGKVFLKAALWDLGISSQENIKEQDWNYYLTYSKGIKVVLENNKDFFISLPVPLERCIKEVADGLVNNIKPFIVDKVSDEDLFKACMEAQPGFKMGKISIVDHLDHFILVFSNIMEIKRSYYFRNRIFVDNNEKNLWLRAKMLFLSESFDNKEFMDTIVNLKGFDAINRDENTVTLFIEESYGNKTMLQEAAEKLNGMFLRDEDNRLVNVKIQEQSPV